MISARRIFSVRRNITERNAALMLGPSVCLLPGVDEERGGREDEEDDAADEGDGADGDPLGDHPAAWGKQRI